MDGEITVDELAALLDDDGDVRIVDIRDRPAFARGHIPGSENLPFHELTTRVAELAGAERIVTVCPHGVSSRQAAQLIASYEGTADARVESLRGGLDAWEGDLATADPADAGSVPDAGSAAGAPTAEPDDAPTAEPDEGPDAPF